MFVLSASWFVTATASPPLPRIPGPPTAVVVATWVIGLAFTLRSMDYPISIKCCASYRLRCLSPLAMIGLCPTLQTATVNRFTPKDLFEKKRNFFDPCKSLRVAHALERRLSWPGGDRGQGANGRGCPRPRLEEIV